MFRTSAQITIAWEIGHIKQKHIPSSKMLFNLHRITDRKDNCAVLLTGTSYSLSFIWQNFSRICEMHFSEFMTSARHCFDYSCHTDVSSFPTSTAPHVGCRNVHCPVSIVLRTYVFSVRNNRTEFLTRVINGSTSALHTNSQHQSQKCKSLVRSPSPIFFRYDCF
jgi:hypothetical protein